MKKIIKIVVIVLLSVGLHSSCNTDFLNTEPLDKIASSTTWTDGPLSQAFIFGVYAYFDYGGFQEQMLAAYTDEAMFTHAGRNIENFTQGSESPSNPAWFSNTYAWASMYSAIRAANVAIKELPTSTFSDDVLRERLMGEAHFLRAYFYHQLVRFYGGVPIIDRPYEINEDYEIARNTWKECVDFIVSDLDKATQMLDGKEVTPGRASKLSAMALMARVLLYDASDLHDGPTAQAKSGTLSGFGNIELVANSSGSRTERWNKAKAAAKAVLDATPGYKLNLSEPVSYEEGIHNYIALSLGGGSAVADASAGVELLLQRTHTPLYTREDNWPLGGINFGINNGPNGYHNWAGNTPIQNLVDDYEMMDGSKFDWNNPEHKAAPYTNRDPRLYGTVLYDGADWKPRPDDVTDREPYDQIQTGYYDDGADGVINGIDTRESPVENWNGSRTGYYVRKFIDPDPSLSDNFSSAQVIPWPFIRTTEMALSYAEACFELGEEAIAHEWINKIRFRAGMPAISDAGEALRDRIRNERRIELAYEEHRYHDARRWMIPAETVGRGIKVMNTQAKLKSGQTPHVPYRYDTDVYEYTYTPVDNTQVETRQWRDRMYFRPILRDEMLRNSLLIQNPGYDTN